MFSLAGVLAHFRRGKPQPDLAPMQKSAADIGRGQASDETRQEFEAWQRQWKGIQQSIDELVAQLNSESRT